MKYYNQKEKQIAIWSSNAKESIAELFYFSEDMFVTAIMERSSGKSKCVVDFNLNASSFRFTSDFTMKNGSIAIASPAESFNLQGKYPYKHLGATKVRGINCQTWTTCKQLDTNQIVTVNISFTDSKYWETASKIPEIPVRMVFGNELIPRTVVDYTDFNSDSDKHDMVKFQPPAGVPCNRKGASIPILPNFFSLKTEITESNPKSVYYLYEWYDYQNKRVKFKYLMPPDKVTTQVHDFVPGVAYNIDGTTGQCTMKLLSKIDSDVHVVLSGKTVKIKQANSHYFFPLNSTQFMYEGQRKARGIDCDVWTAVDKSSNSTIIWRFFYAIKDFRERNAKNNKKSWLIMYELLIPEQKIHTIFNVYEYEEVEPPIWDFDIRSCFPEVRRKEVYFAVSAIYSNVISTNEKRFRNDVIGFFHGYAKISSLRVTDIEVYYRENDVLVSLLLLDNAPLSGQITHQPSLDEVFKSFTDAIKQHTFEIYLEDSDGKVTRIPVNAGGEWSRRTTNIYPKVTTTPTKVKTTTTKVKTTPTKVKTTSTKVKTTSTKVKTTPTKVKTTPTKVKTTPTTDKIKPTTDKTKPSTGKSDKQVQSNVPGKMAGVGIGMLLLGVVLASISFVFYYKRCLVRDRPGLLDQQEL